MQKCQTAFPPFAADVREPLKNKEPSTLMSDGERLGADGA